MKRKVIAEVALKDIRISSSIPLKGERYVHHSNKRTIVVVKTKVEVSPLTRSLMTYVVYKYERGIGGNNVGWKRLLTPEQEIPLHDWRGFFRERAP